MKQIPSILLFFALSMSSSASAVTLTIEDTYIGGGYQNTYAHNNGDVIAGNSGNHVRQERYINEFNIDGMTVEIDGQGNIKVIIQTDYCPNIAGTGTDYGDLFISTDGWNQDMNSTFYTSRDADGEYWEFVFDTNTGSFYYTQAGAYQLSESFFGPGSGNTQPNAYYRINQVARVNADAITTAAVTTGQFIVGTDETGNNVMIYTGFNLADTGLNPTESCNLAFRWTMTCANDIIEGGVNWQSIPEPGTMALLGVGLLILGTMGRRFLESFNAEVKTSRGASSQYLLAGA